MSITAKTVNLKDGSTAIKLETPYHPDLPKRLRQLGGHGWNDAAKAWYLPADVKAQISKVCLDIFSVDPFAETPGDLVNIQIDISSMGLRIDTLWMFGRSVLRRMNRDSDVRPGEGVSVLSGGFARSGGSRNNPCIGAPDDDTTLLIRNVPRTALEQFAQHYPELTPVIIELTPQQ